MRRLTALLVSAISWCSSSAESKPGDWNRDLSFFSLPPFFAKFSPVKGRGVFASRYIKKGELVHDGTVSAVNCPKPWHDDNLFTSTEPRIYHLLFDAKNQTTDLGCWRCQCRRIVQFWCNYATLGMFLGHSLTTYCKRLWPNLFLQRSPIAPSWILLKVPVAIACLPLIQRQIFFSSSVVSMIGI